MDSKDSVGLRGRGTDHANDQDDHHGKPQDPPPQQRIKLADEWPRTVLPESGADASTAHLQSQPPSFDVAHREDGDASNLGDTKVAPFLTKHIRGQYAPLNRLLPTGQPSRSKNPNSKY